MAGRRRQRVEHTEDWEQLRLLVKWPEQERYEEIRPLVLFGDSVFERTEETRTSERTLYRRVESFERDGVESLFATERARRKVLPPWIRGLIVNLKAEYPPFNLNEIANVVYVHSGRKPDVRTVRNVLEGSALPLKIVRLFDPYHEIREGRERRMAVVSLHSSGWSAKAIAGYLKVNRDTVYEVLRRWVREGPDGLEDRKRGRPRGTGKVDLRTMNEMRRLQQNPGLGAFRVHAALKQIGIHLSERTCGRILAINRRIYGYEKPKTSGAGAKKPMPFASSRRHEYWTADVRYIDEHRVLSEGRLYVVAILENHSRAILSSAVTRSQDLSAFLSVLYRAVERYGSPEALVTDSGSIFLANRAKAIYDSLGIAKHEIERGRPWQSYVETAFNVQRRMADWHFAKAASWPEIVHAHDRFVEEYNGQAHFAHLGREDGRRSPGEVLGWVTGVRYLPEDLERAFFSTRHSRILDELGYARFRHWRVYGEEGLARKEAEVWLQERSLTIEYAREALSRYDVEILPGSTKLKGVSRPELFENSNVLPQLRLFGLEALGDGRWLKSLKLDEYAPRGSRRPTMLQAALFPFLAGTGG
jgi:transposase